MIFRPYSKNYPAGTIIAMSKGPITNRNWYNTVNPPTYSIIQNGTGSVALRGTNNIALRGENAPNPVEWNFLPTDNATWTDIVSSTSANATGTFSTEYQFLALFITVQGTGQVTQAYVFWN